MKNTNLNWLTKVFLTCCFLGNTPKFPGTVGSFFALLITYGINYSYFFYGGQSSVMCFHCCAFFGLCILFVISIFFIDYYHKITEHIDPSEIIIDEIVGQILTVWLVYLMLYCCNALLVTCQKLICNSVDISFLLISFVEVYKILCFKKSLVANGFVYLLSFVLFRVFDIFKPWPISFIQLHCKNGVGVMLDDILAALFASICVVVTYVTCYFLVTT